MGYCKVLQGTAGYCMVLLDTIGYYWGTGWYRGELESTGGGVLRDYVVVFMQLLQDYVVSMELGQDYVVFMQLEQDYTTIFMQLL